MFLINHLPKRPYARAWPYLWLCLPLLLWLGCRQDPVGFTQGEEYQFTVGSFDLGGRTFTLDSFQRATVDTAGRAFIRIDIRDDEHRLYVDDLDAGLFTVTGPYGEGTAKSEDFAALLRNTSPFTKKRDKTPPAETKSMGFGELLRRRMNDR